MRVLDLVRPVQSILPEVEQAPKGKVGLQQKLVWTLLALLVYLVCAQMPLYGIAVSKKADPFYIMRMVR